VRSPVELWFNPRNLPPRERIVDVASFFLGLKYELDPYDGKLLDGKSGRALRVFDASSFVRWVFHQVFPESGLRIRADLNPLSFQGVELFKDVKRPRAGDIVCWEKHVGIINNTRAGTFISAQGAQGVVEASYKKGYWAMQRPVIKFRRWKKL
jgi:cell wall-associated NlpC family hydrolase